MVYQGAGLLFWQDESTFVRLEQGDRNNQHDVELLAFNGQATLKTVSVPGGLVSLRLQRRGDTITAWWIGSDGAKHLVGTITLHFTHIEVGLALVNNSHKAATVADNATFSTFTFTCS